MTKLVPLEPFKGGFNKTKLGLKYFVDWSGAPGNSYLQDMSLVAIKLKNTL